MEATRGRYAWVCLELYLDKGLIAKVLIGRRVHKVEYEAIKVICEVGLTGIRRNCALVRTPFNPSRNLALLYNSACAAHLRIYIIYISLHMENGLLQLARGGRGKKGVPLPTTNCTVQPTLSGRQQGAANTRHGLNPFSLLRS